MVELVQKVTELNLKCDKMELGDSSQAKTLSTEFDADLTVFSQNQYLSGEQHSKNWSLRSGLITFMWILPRQELSWDQLELWLLKCIRNYHKMDKGKFFCHRWFQVRRHTIFALFLWSCLHTFTDLAFKVWFNIHS